MQLLIDFLPIALFFIAYKLGGIYSATITAIIASIFQVIWNRKQKGRFEKMPLFGLALITVLGGATLLFKNEAFIKWKPSALYWVLALIFLGSHFIGKQPLLQQLMEKQVFALPSQVWKRLNVGWSVFFGLMGCLNLYVAERFDTETWVHFKLFGCLALTLIFVIAQGWYMSRHQQHSIQPDKEKVDA